MCKNISDITKFLIIDKPIVEKAQSTSKFGNVFDSFELCAHERRPLHTALVFSYKISGKDRSSQKIRAFSLEMWKVNGLGAIIRVKEDVVV